MKNTQLLLSVLCMLVLTACEGVSSSNGLKTKINPPLSYAQWQIAPIAGKTGNKCVISTNTWRGLTVELSKNAALEIVNKVKMNGTFPHGTQFTVRVGNDLRRTVAPQFINADSDAVVRMMLGSEDRAYVEWLQTGGAGSGSQRFSTILPLEGFKLAYNQCQTEL